MFLLTRRWWPTRLPPGLAPGRRDVAAVATQRSKGPANEVAAAECQFPRAVQELGWPIERPQTRTFCQVGWPIAAAR